MACYPGQPRDDEAGDLLSGECAPADGAGGRGRARGKREERVRQRSVPSLPPGALLAPRGHSGLGL